MSMQKPIHWINNQTRLNAQNMNTIGAALDDIGQQLYGETYDNSGLINTVSIHSGWFTGDTGGDKQPNSGLFTQMEQVGKALLCPSFSCVSSGKWASGGYDYKTITSHKTTLPKIEAIGTWGNTPTEFTESEKVKICLDDGNTQRSLIGPSKDAKNNTLGTSYIDLIAGAILWNTERLISLGNVYRPTGIFTDNSSFTLSTPSYEFLSFNKNGDNVLRLGENAEAVEIVASDGSYIQGSSPASVVILGNVTELSQIDDTNKNTLSGERTIREATDNAIKLAIISEVEARKQNDTRISEVVNDAISEVSSINNSLNFFAEEPTVTPPTAKMTYKLVANEESTIEVGTKVTTIQVKNVTYTSGKYTYGSVDMLDTNTPATDSNGYYTYKPGTGLENSDFSRILGAAILTANGSTLQYTVSGSTLTGNTDYYFVDGDVLSITCDISHPAGDFPVDSIGRTVKSKRIAANSITDIDTRIVAYRKPFWGYKPADQALDNPANITSAQIRSLGESGTSVSDLPTSYDIPADTKQVFFAAKKGTRNSLSIENVTQQPATSVACTKVTDIQVADARGGETNSTAYDVWYVNPDSAFTKLTKLQLTWS